MLDIYPGMWYYNTRKREKQKKERGKKNEKNR